VNITLFFRNECVLHGNLFLHQKDGQERCFLKIFAMYCLVIAFFFICANLPPQKAGYGQIGALTRYQLFSIP
jgi:hypothetical protein